MVIESDDQSFPGFFGINSGCLPELMFTPEECDRLIQSVDEAYPSSASVGGGGPGHVKREIRSADIFSIENNEQYRWVWDKVGNITSIVNKIHFDYDLAGITHSLQLIRYDSEEDVKGHYNWHVDAGPGTVAARKISFTVQLSDPNTYEGCDLIVNDHGNEIKGSRERGSLNLFPSYAPHKVTPIEKGVRYSLVIWVHGSRRFR
jgi:PKHD-type hydroxylase